MSPGLQQLTYRGEPVVEERQPLLPFTAERDLTSLRFTAVALQQIQLQVSTAGGCVCKVRLMQDETLADLRQLVSQVLG